ncbi:response regulator [bacterium]|nr:response regulator [bacterium]
MMTTLLIADDEQTFLDFMVRLLQKDHKLLIARNWSEVLEKFESNLWRLNATILDVNMPGLRVDPFSMVGKLLKSNPTVPMVVISGQDIVLRHEFLKMGIFQYHGKPIDMMDLKLTIKNAIGYNRVMRKLENYEKNERDELKFYSRLYSFDITEVRERIKSHDVSDTKVPVLFRTEPGTRPNMLAKIISEEVDRKLYFEKICSQNLKNILPYNLQNGDVLFLEGIENLAPEEHAELLRVLDETEVNGEQNGSTVPMFRLIASTANQTNNGAHCPELVQLIDKLSKVEFRIEPLRLRRHELRSLISLVFEKTRRDTLVKPSAISDELYNLLIDYDWPLNYEELIIVVKSLLLTCNDSELLPKHLHQLDFSDIANSKYPTLDDMVAEHIKKALRMTMGNKSRAARMLGITPKTLYARIRTSQHS